MAYHEWGDGFDFSGLEKAATWVAKFYQRKTGHSVIWKEKYGTIRWEYTWSWLKTNKEALIMCEIIRRATLKYPQFKTELTCDWVTCLNEKSKNSMMSYYIGYFTALTAWWPKSRPYKPFKRDDYSKYN